MSHVMIVCSPYYKDVAEKLLAGTKAALDKASCSYEIFEVPGALEIPLAINMGAQSGAGFDAYVALGCVLRGETSHYDIVCNESARGLTQLALDHDLIIGNAILTCETMEQAIVRADPAQKNKGADAVAAIVSLMALKKKLPAGQK